MKKIILLVALITTAFFTHAQKVYDFTGSANPGSWVAAGSGISVTPSAAGLVFDFGAGVPRIDITRVADPFDVSVGTHMIVTLVNNSTEVGSFGGFFDKNGSGLSGTQFLAFQTGMIQATAPGSGVEATYVFKLESNNYQNDMSSGSLNDTDGFDNMEYVGIRFRDASSSNLGDDSATNGNIILKKIEIVNAGTIINNDYDFINDDLVGFSAINGGSITDGGTTLNFSGDNSNVGPKLVQDFYAVDASNKFAHVVVAIKSSNADQVKFQFVDASSAVKTYGNQTLTTGTPIDFALGSKPEWTGNIKEWRLVFSNSGGAPVDTGSIQISEFVFDNSPTLSLKENALATFTMYPNPANNVLNIKSASSIEKVDIYNIVGKQILSTKGFVNSTEINISNLSSGVYLVKIIDQNNNSAIKKLILK